jgi:uncharacterized alkaline shock family protein YloU
MNRDESRTDLGKIKIHQDVIASVAAIAATEIDGVKAISRGIWSSLKELVGRRDFGAIRVDIDRNGDVWVVIPVVVKYGYNIPDVANRVQENVRLALDKMTNLSIRDITISVQSIEKA